MFFGNTHKHTSLGNTHVIDRTKMLSIETPVVLETNNRSRDLYVP
jgi:hypothetical protein